MTKTAVKAKEAAPEAEAQGDDLSQRIKDLRERRKSRGTRDQAGYKLSVNQDALDPRFKYRWVNEENLSMRQAEATFSGDWELVPNTDGKLTDGRNVEQKSTIARSVEKGSKKRAYLMRKPKVLWDDDHNTKLEKIKSTEDQMKRDGVARGGDSLLDSSEASTAYKPAQMARAYKP